jgi:hypothetical protein
MAPTWSVLANRKDVANQSFWTEKRISVVDGCCPAQPGDIVALGPGCKIDPCLLPSSSGLVIEINGVVSPCQSVLNFIPGSGIDITYTPDCGYTFTATGSPTDCGSAAYLCTDTATPVQVDISAPTHAGMMLISQPGNATAIWADPQVQGLYAAGSTICPAPAYVAPTCIQPVLVGGADPDGNLQNVAVTTGGSLVTISQDQETEVGVLRFAATTGYTLVSNPTAGYLAPLLSIQPKAGATGVTFTFRTSDFLTQGSMVHYRLTFNSTLTGANFVNVDPASSMTYDVSATTATGGRLIDAGCLGGQSARNNFEFHFGFTGGTPDIITLSFCPVAGSKSSSAGCSFAWDEQA